MSVRRNSCEDSTSLKPILSNTGRVMDSFMEKFSQFLISDPTNNSNSLFSDNFLQKANDFYNQKSMNKSYVSQSSKKSVSLSVWIILINCIILKVLTVMKMIPIGISTTTIVIEVERTVKIQV